MDGSREALQHVRAEKLRGSIDALPFPDHSFDLVYIDANHDEEPFRQDLRMWKSKVRDGGILAGHDYQGSWPGVIKVVDEVLGGPDKVYQDTSWIKRL